MPAGVVVAVEMVKVEATGPLVLVIVTLELENAGVIPTLEGAFASRLMVPVKPLRPISVMTDVLLAAVSTDRDVGVALIPKFGTGTLMMTLTL